MEKRRIWSKEEEAILVRHYPPKGARRTQKILAKHGYERTIKSIIEKARKSMVYRDAPDGYISVHWAKRSSGDQFYKILFEACQDGVLLDTKAEYMRYFVPVEWAEKNFIAKDKDRT